MLSGQFWSSSDLVAKKKEKRTPQPYPHQQAQSGDSSGRLLASFIQRFIHIVSNGVSSILEGLRGQMCIAFGDF
jgi:hypothetical protein